MANRLWGSAGGLLTAALVATFFTTSLQGYYYTFLSLLTLQTFVELGFGELLQQFVSHEWALSTPTSEAGSRERALDRLAALIKLALNWYTAAALVLFLGLGVSGHFYFRAFASTEVSWKIAWWLAVLATAASVLLTPMFALLEGVNRVETVQGVRLAQGLLSRIAGFLAIVFGAGLFTVPVARVVSLSVGAFGLGRKFLRFVVDLGDRGGGATVSWQGEFLPVQWKFALSWLSGYVVYSLFTPVLFAFHDPALAGRMGLTLAAASAISSAAFAVTATKVPRLAIFAARRDYRDMDSLFFRATLSSMAVALIGSGLLFGGLLVLRALPLALAERFLPPLETGLLLAAFALQQLRFSMGSYLRAHKAEPFVFLSVAEGLVAIPLFTLLGRNAAALGMILGFLGLTTATLVPAVAIFFRCRTLWHPPRLMEAS
jgi:hypothetical protein